MLTETQRAGPVIHPCQDRFPQSPSPFTHRSMPSARRDAFASLVEALPAAWSTAWSTPWMSRGTRTRRAGAHGTWTRRAGGHGMWARVAVGAHSRISYVNDHGLACSRVGPPPPLMERGRNTRSADPRVRFARRCGCHMQRGARRGPRVLAPQWWAAVRAVAEIIARGRRVAARVREGTEKPP
jgi:hypothetical protein